MSIPTVNAVALVSTMVAALIDKPEEMVISAEKLEDRYTIRVAVAPTDIGKVIGKQGRTARSLRMILGGHAKMVGKVYALDIQEVGLTGVSGQG